MDCSHQAPLSVGFCRQEYWSGLPCPPSEKWNSLSLIRLFVTPWTVYGILQAMEWVAFPFSRGSSQPRDQIQVSIIAGRFFTIWTTRETLGCYWNKTPTVPQLKLVFSLAFWALFKITKTNSTPSPHRVTSYLGLNSYIPSCSELVRITLPWVYELHLGGKKTERQAVANQKKQTRGHFRWPKHFRMVQGLHCISKWILFPAPIGRNGSALASHSDLGYITGTLIFPEKTWTWFWK